MYNKNQIDYFYRLNAADCFIISWGNHHYVIVKNNVYSITKKKSSIKTRWDLRTATTLKWLLAISILQIILWESYIVVKDCAWAHFVEFNQKENSSGCVYQIQWWSKSKSEWWCQIYQRQKKIIWKQKYVWLKIKMVTFH